MKLDLQGWFSFARLYVRAVELLKKEVTGIPVVVEVGVWKGRSFAYLCQSLHEEFGNRKFELHGVDDFRPAGSKPQSLTSENENLELKQLEQKGVALADVFKNNMRLLNLGDSFHLWETDSRLASERFQKRGTISDFTFIDAGHSYEEVCRDVQSWRPLSRQLGGHDWSNPDVRRAVEENVDAVYAMPEIDCWTTWKELAQAVNVGNTKTLLGVPAGAEGSVSLGTLKGIVNGLSNFHEVEFLATASSLLTHQFNNLVCAALNAEMDRLIILHSDICPTQPDWIDRMLGLMDEHELDVLSAVAPIKDANGLTSTAVDTDRWRPKRLTMAEVMDLPPTFSRPDLLVNTGLLAIRMDQEWSNRINFDFSNRIVKVRNNNGSAKPANPTGPKRPAAYVAEVEPEDWKFSRWCNEMGLRVAATTEIRLTHKGSIPYSNAGSWGKMKTDLGNDPDAVSKLRRMEP